MDEETRKELGRIWQANEQRLHEAQELKASSESPAHTEARIDAEQEEIEGELSADWYRRHRDSLAEGEDS